VGIDVTRQDKLAFGVDDGLPCFRDVGAVRDDRCNVVAFNFDGAIRDDFSGAGIDQGAIDDKRRVRRSGEGGCRTERSQGQERKIVSYI
jgi:hypothetical protein